MKRHVAVRLVALYASAYVALAAYIAHELPASAVDGLDSDDWLEEDRVGKVHLRYPNGANDVRPQTAIGLLERTGAIRAEYARDRSGRGLYAASTEPLTC